MFNPFAAGRPLSPTKWRYRNVRGLFFVECKRRWLPGWCYITLRRSRFEAEEFIRLEQARARGLSEE